VNRHRIAWHEKTLGQLFCDDSAQQIIDMLRDECDRGHVEWRRPCVVASVERGDEHFRIATDQGEFAAASLVIATGGLTVPKIGATPFGYRIAEQFGLKVVPPRPALVPLSFAPEELEKYGDLAGISIDAEVSCGEGRFRENLLFTHRGLSGPAILQVSSYWQDGPPTARIHVNLLPAVPAQEWLAARRRERAHASNLLAEILPKRFAQQWGEANGLAVPVVQLSDRAIAKAVHDLHDWQVHPSGTLGYNKAEVTLGGVDTRGLSSKTMEAATVRGLYFIGEVVDVTGHLGGFNFQWAWSSGFACGMSC